MTLAISEIDREPRVLDLDLANHLAFDRPRKIREIIARNRDELEQYGEVVFRAAPSGNRGGRPTTECWLNEGQALLLCMFSQTSRAAAVRKELIEVFMDWRAGKTVAVKEHRRRPPTPAPVICEPFTSFSSMGLADGTYVIEAHVSARVERAMSRAFLSTAQAMLAEAKQLAPLA